MSHVAWIFHSLVSTRTFHFPWKEDGLFSKIPVCVLDLFNADQMQLASEDKHLTAILKWGLFRTVQEKHHVFVVAFSPNHIPLNPIRRPGGGGGIEKRTFWKDNNNRKVVVF